MCNRHRYSEEDKIFTITKSELNGRLDPKMALYNKKIILSPYPIVKLRSLLLSKPQYGANVPGIIRRNNLQPRYIRITDINEYGLINTEELGVSAKNVEDKYILNVNDILFARSGATVGKVYIHRKQPYLCLYAGYLIRFIVDPSKVLPDYLFAYTQLSPYKKWIKAIQRPSAQPNINAEEFQSLEIPLPDMPIQKKIVKHINDAYIQKQEKETEAQKLLNSIDEYILTELGVSVPETDTTLRSRIFFVNKKNISSRLNPGLYKNSLRLISDRYDNIPLSYLAYINPTTIFHNATEETPISFIPMESIDEEYSEIIGYMRTTVRESPGYTRFQEGDLLWAKITPCMENGKSIIAKNLVNGYGCGSTEYHIIRPKNSKLMIEFIHLLLHMKIVRQTAVFYFGGSAGQQRVASDFLEKFNVPLPPIFKQQEIVKHILDIKMQAKSLKEEGNRILNNAKREIEKQLIY